jgi:hypothetical protein
MALALNFAVEENAGSNSQGLLLAVVPVMSIGYAARQLFLFAGW